MGKTGENREEDCNLFLITGNDKEQISAEGARQFVLHAGENPDPFAVDIISEGDEGFSAANINNAVISLQSPSFLGGRKVVWLKHCTGFDMEGDSKDDSPEGRAFQKLTSFIKSGLPEDMVLIMDGTGADGRRQLSKACKEKGRLIVLDKPDMAKKGWEADMRECIQRAARQKGVQLDYAAADFLLEVLGTDAGRVPQELEKVICYRGHTDGVITLEEVQQVCEGKGEEMSWALSEALGRRDAGEALRMVDVLITQNKENEQYARAMLLSAAGFFRNAIRIKVFMQSNNLKTPVALSRYVQGMSGESRAEAVSEGMDFVSFHPYRVQMMAAQCGNYTPNEVIRGIKVFRDALWQSVSSSTSPRVALESALLRVLGTGRRNLNP